MQAALITWVFASSVWTLFCIFDKFRTWIRFRRWKNTVYQCERESVQLLLLVVREISHANERMRRNSSPSDITPNVQECKSYDSGDC
jgi:hypothetical protein